VAEPFIGEIRMFAGNFAPRGYALCDGQLLAVSQNEALFSMFGTIYGGDGRTTFGVPDLRGRVPIHYATDTDGSFTPRNLGASGGSQTATVSASQVPPHSHTLEAAVGPGQSELPAGRQFATTDAAEPIYRDAEPDVSMNASIVQDAGGSASHENMMPFAVIYFIVALLGIYPSEN